VNSHRYLLESYLQDTWKVSRRVTLDYGVRLLWFKPWYTKLPAATFVPERYDPAKAPRLYQPARVNNANVALDPVTGAVKPNIYVGSFVPGTGDPYNGMVLGTDPNYPKGFRQNQGLQPEPRLGFAWDVTGQAKTAVHGGLGLFHNSQITARSMDQAATNPPAVNSPQFVYGTMSTLLSQAGFSLRPSTVNALERDAKTPSTYQWSLGVQQEIGWGMVADLTYVGWVGRHMEQYTNINVVPDGAKFVNLHPENANPQNTANAKPTTSCARTSATATSSCARTSGPRTTTGSRCSSAAATATASSSRWRTPTRAPSASRTKTSRRLASRGRSRPGTMRRSARARPTTS